MLDAWQYTRRLSYDLLKSLNQSELLWKPGPGTGEFWKQFRHVGRVQEDYLTALDSGSIAFSCQNKSYSAGPNKDALCKYLSDLDQALTTKLKNIDPNKQIDWFGESVDVKEHLARLHAHETLHQGQWIVYCQLSGRDYPASWSDWGL